MNIDLGMASETVFIHYDPVVWKLNWISIFSCIANILYNLIKPSEKIVNDISNLTDDVLVNLLLYGSQSFNFEENSTIIKASIKYILSTERFSGPLIWPFNISNYIKSIFDPILFFQLLFEPYVLLNVECKFSFFLLSLSFFRR